MQRPRASSLAVVVAVAVAVGVREVSRGLTAFLIALKQATRRAHLPLARGEGSRGAGGAGAAGLTGDLTASTA